MSSFTDPFQLKHALKKQSYHFDIIALFDVMLIALIFTWLGSQYIFAPGIRVELPSLMSEKLSGVSSLVFATVKQKDMIFFKSGLYDLNSFEKELSNQLIDYSNKEVTLLLRVNKDVDLQTFLEVCDAAKAIGINQIQIAVEAER